MDRKLFFKLATIGLLILLLMVPLSLIQGQITQRSQRQAEVQNNIAQTAAGPQTLVGPVLAVRYRELLPPETAKDASGRETTVRKQAERVLFLPAARLDIKGQATVESRSRGIYKARLFHLNLTLAGNIPVPAHLGLDPRADILEAHADLLLGLSDLRGMDNDPDVLINGAKYQFKAGGNPSLPGQQVSIPLGRLDPVSPSRFDFSFPLNLTGTERLAIAPTAEANTVTLASDWRHPSFQGRFLPRTRKVSASGFEAQWEISHLARNFDNALKANGSGGEVLEIAFMEPVNIYLQSERAVKYGSLFIVLTFAAFFLGEILRRRPMHFMQYLLVGLALAIFFLLLIALSEHLPFAWAYLASAMGCIGLVTAYLSGVFGGARPALAFGAGFTGLYGVLYGVLQSEDNSLLMGSLLLFLALGAIMLTTRRLDWYGLGLARPGHCGE
ncbi:MAG: cell envelope integrity protein CreD [Rhodocyclaceae bacterium]|nr:cell envelope integrity protein CreD [Rhodocyclaceae bacterium]